ncbi:MAG: glycosyltransferase family 4 protein [Candidatus Paceibacterota bacterium]|jgi:glycosyltransferase involved in cell wall biosynthesis
MTPKIKIFYLITKGNFGGAQRYVYDLATALPRTEFETTVIMGEFETLEKKLMGAGIKTIKIPTLGRDINLIKDLKSFWQILKILKKEKPQIVHLNSSKIGGLGALAGRMTGVPKIIFTVHGLAFNEKRPGWQKVLIKFSHWLSIILCHEVITVADCLRQQINSWPGVNRKVTTINSGLPPIKFFEQSVARRELFAGHNDRFWIGTIAELHPNKGLDLLIEAFALTVRALLGDSLGWSINLMIVGEGEELEKLKWLTRAKRLEDRIHFLGRVEDARAYLKAFDIFTLTSRTEAFPYVILEAGAAGLPVIASEVGGIPELITDPELGILVPSGSVEEIKKSLLFMLKKPKYRDLVGKNLRQRVSANFSLKKMVEKTVELYKEG